MHNHRIREHGQKVSRIVLLLCAFDPNQIPHRRFVNMDELSLEIVVEVEQYIAYKRVNKGDKTILISK